MKQYKFDLISIINKIQLSTKIRNKYFDDLIKTFKAKLLQKCQLSVKQLTTQIW